MKLKLLKDHVLGKADEVVEVTAELGNYLVSCKVGVEVKASVNGDSYSSDVKPKKAKKK